MQASDIQIDHEEDGFHLLVKTEDGEWFDFHIQENAENLYDQCRSRIGPWLRERDHAALTRRMQPLVDAAFACDPDESGGYDISDPKHPDYHSIHADIWDAREGK